MSVTGETCTLSIQRFDREAIIPVLNQVQFSSVQFKMVSMRLEFSETLKETVPRPLSRERVKGWTLDWVGRYMFQLYCSSHQQHGTVYMHVAFS